MGKMNSEEENRLDEIAERLFKNSRVTDEEIERIINRPPLLNAVKAQIQREKSRRRRKASTTVAGLFKTPIFSRLLLPTVGVLSIVAVLATILFLLKNQSFRQSSGKDFSAVQSAGLTEKPSERFSLPVTEKPVSDSRANLKNEVSGDKTATVADVAPSRKKTLKQFSGVRKNIRRTAPAQIDLPDDKANNFYALNSTGIFDNDGDRRIVRVEISRLKLYALGANIAVENEPETVVADLLVGTDGNARAYRLVR